MTIMTKEKRNESRIRCDYYNWLGSIVGTSWRGRKYDAMLSTLSRMEFYFYIPNDDNRAADGVELRMIFADEMRYDPHEANRVVNDILAGPCSVLEMMVAFARRIESDVMYDELRGDRTRLWFWTMCENLGLTDFYDGGLPYEFDSKIREIVSRMMDRRYSPSGEGGMFPLKHAKRDQTRVELWFQMQDYMEENYE